MIIWRLDAQHVARQSTARSFSPQTFSPAPFGSACWAPGAPLLPAASAMGPPGRKPRVSAGISKHECPPGVTTHTSPGTLNTSVSRVRHVVDDRAQAPLLTPDVVESVNSMSIVQITELNDLVDTRLKELRNSNERECRAKCMKRQAGQKRKFASALPTLPDFENSAFMALINELLHDVHRRSLELRNSEEDACPEKCMSRKSGKKRRVPSRRRASAF